MSKSDASSPWSEQQLARYRASARARQAQELDARARRCDQGWQLARQAAALLKKQFGAQTVLAFGSLVQPELFHARSDVDLAVTGLPERHYYRAVAALLALDPDWVVDLVRVEEAPASLRERIAQEGHPL